MLVYMHKCIYHHPSNEYGLIPNDPVINHVTALVQTLIHLPSLDIFTKYVQLNGDAKLPWAWLSKA